MIATLMIFGGVLMMTAHMIFRDAPDESVFVAAARSLLSSFTPSPRLPDEMKRSLNALDKVKGVGE